jgi:DNA-binding transcriptional MerR regulator
MDRFLMGTDVAHILRVSAATVRRMAQRGELPVAATTKSGVRLYDRSDVMRLAKERAQSREDR